MISFKHHFRVHSILILTTLFLFISSFTGGIVAAEDDTHIATNDRSTRSQTAQVQNKTYLPLIDRGFQTDRPVDSPPFGAAEPFSARAEANLGDGFLSNDGDDWLMTRGQTWTDIRSTPRKMAANFVADADNTTIAVFFTAEAYVDTPRKRMFVRALIDGVPANPSDVVFATGTSPESPETRGFIFTDQVDQGIHTVEIQWLVDREATAYMRDASLLIRQNSEQTSQRSLVVGTPDSGPNITTEQNAWTNIPGMSAGVFVNDGETLVASMSVESFVSQDKSMFVRALVNGVPMEPENVLFARGTRPQSRMVTLGAKDLPTGFYNVTFQWSVHAGGTATVGDRTLLLAAAPEASAAIAQEYVVAPSGPAVSTNSTNYQVVPDMQISGTIPPNGEVAVIFSGETSNVGGEKMFVRLRVGGEVVDESEVQLAISDQHMGVHSYIFSAKHINAGEGRCVGCAIQLEWRSGSGDQVSLGDRSMVVLVKHGAVPDLAEPPVIGMGNVGVESAIGERNVLAILWDPQRPAHPAPSIADLEQVLFGPVDSAQDYYDKVSNGKFSIANAGVEGPYIADNPADHYWEDYPACDAPDTTGLTGGHQEKWAEAITKASATVNFADYDYNKDGVLDFTEELAVLVVIPQNTEFGTVRNLNPYCSGAPFEVDGVRVPVISEWYANAAADKFTVPAHELAHQLLALGDLYERQSDKKFHIQPGKYELMDTITNNTPHMNPAYKLALGWVTPGTIVQDGAYELEDIKQSHKVYVLPRTQGGDSKEYYLLENRQNSANNPLYDENIGSSGIGVWHIVEDAASNSAAPQCISGADWSVNQDDNPRSGIRLLRPSLLFSGDSMWDATNYDLLDAGLVCPSDGVAQNVLIWADGAASGYEVTNFSPSAPVMSFSVDTP